MTMSNIVDFVKNQVSEKVVDKLHSFLGIPEEKIHRGLDAIIPAIVGSISEHAGKGNAGLMDLMKPFMGDDFDFGKMAAKSGGLTDLLHTGHTLLGGLFGDGLGDAVKAVAKSAALDDHVAGKLMRLTAPGVASGVVDGLGAGAGLDQLKGALGGHLETVKGGIPDGLGFTAAGLAALGLGAAGLSSAGSSAEAPEVKAVEVKSVEVPAVEVAKIEQVAAPVTEVVEEAKTTGAGVAAAVAGVAVAGAGALRITVGDTAEVEKAHAPVVEGVKGTVKEPVKAAAAFSAPVSSGSSSPVSTGYGNDGGDQKSVVFAGFFIMLALLGVAGYFGLRGLPPVVETDPLKIGQTEMPATSTETVPDANKPAEATKVPDAKAPETAATVGDAKSGDIQVELDGGAMLKAAPDGVEYKLVDFIKSAKPVDKTSWFSFDRLYFDTAKSSLKPESQVQLENIVTIMKAYPKVKLKIGGYTDNKGNDTFNMKLSGDRANATMAKLVAMGVAKDRLAAEGFGKQFPVATNDTEEGRAKNRRIDVRVTAK